MKRKTFTKREVVMFIAFLYKHSGISNFINLGFCDVILEFFLSQNFEIRKRRWKHCLHSLWFTFSFGLLISVFSL